MGKYLDPKADLTFKKLFGEHKNLVISLLNALLPLQDGEYVESIEYWPAEKIPNRTEAEKYSIVDVCCFARPLVACYQRDARTPRRPTWHRR